MQKMNINKILILPDFLGIPDIVVVVYIKLFSLASNNFQSRQFLTFLVLFSVRDVDFLQLYLN